MKQYLEALRRVRDTGTRVTNRTGVDTLRTWGYQMRFDLRQGFPILTTKKIFFKGVVVELLWMISGSTNVKAMQEQGVHIWNEWASEDGELGPVYGNLWRHWPDPFQPRVDMAGERLPEGYDQLAAAIQDIKTNPESRRIIVTAWEPTFLPEQRLPPCHLLYHFGCEGPFLDCHMMMRSADLFLGVPFNIASYALLTSIVAQITGRIARNLVVSFSDLHLYVNHLQQVEEQLSREPRKLPELYIQRTFALNDPKREKSEIKTIDDFSLRDFSLGGYDPHPAIKAEVAV